MWRFLFKVLFRSATALIFLCLLYLGVAYLCSLIPRNKGWENYGSHNRHIYIYSNGVHCDIMFPLSDKDYPLEKLFAPEIESLQGKADYLAFGWGDEKFYAETPRWKDLKAGTALKALSGFGKSAIHVTSWYRAPETGDQCRRIKLSEAQYRVLLAGILKELEFSEGKPHKLPLKGYGNNDWFFGAKGSYFVFYTCNVWTGESLNAARIMTAFWTPCDWSILNQLPDAE